jgi:uncharacterized protein with PQ loop repeat
MMNFRKHEHLPARAATNTWSLFFLPRSLYIMTPLVFGWLAAAISSVFRIPQIFHIVDQGSVKDLSFVSLLCQFVVCPLYVAHGIVISDLPTIVMGSLSGVQASIILILYLYYVDNLTMLTERFIKVNDVNPRCAFFVFTFFLPNECKEFIGFDLNFDFLSLFRRGRPCA